MSINKNMRFLITGAGGDIGESIARILLLSGIEKENLIGCDCEEYNRHGLFFGAVDKLISAEMPFYYNELSDLVKKHNIDCIIPSTEQEISALIRCKKVCGAPVISANQHAVLIGLNKLKTAYFLEKRGLNFPKTSSKIEKWFDYPIIVKPKIGRGSNGVFIANREKDIGLEITDSSIFQEYLFGDEYTCGVYRTKDHEVRTIVFKRVLRGGLTQFGEVYDNSDIDDYLTKVTDLLNLQGSINIQLILTDRGPVIFEINPRFSSTVMFRHQLGFTDLLWSLSETFGGIVGDWNHDAIIGKKIYRGTQEHVF